MKILNKFVGFLAVCSVVPAAYALTARPGVVNPWTSASRRLPTMTTYLTGNQRFVPCANAKMFKCLGAMYCVGHK